MVKGRVFWEWIILHATSKNCWQTICTLRLKNKKKKQVTNILSTRFIHTNIFRWFPRFPLANKNRIQIHVSCYTLLTTVEYILVLHRYVIRILNTIPAGIRRIALHHNKILCSWLTNSLTVFMRQRKEFGRFLGWIHSKADWTSLYRFQIHVQSLF